MTLQDLIGFLGTYRLCKILVLNLAVLQERAELLARGLENFVEAARRGQVGFKLRRWCCSVVF